MNIKKIISILLAALLIAATFAGCSSTEDGELNDETMIVAYTEEVEPFLYTDNNKLTGFDVDVFDSIFESVKGDYKTYKLVKVASDYKLNEDVATTDSEGNEYKASILIGGVQKNVGTRNEDWAWSQNIIENRIVTVVPSGSKITSYSNLASAKVGVVGNTAKNALASNSTINSSVTSSSYVDADSAFKDLNSGKINAVVIDEFTLYKTADYSKYTILNGELDTIEYAFACAKSDDQTEAINEAIKEMLDKDYGDGDTLTPLVEKYFGNSAVCVFEYDAEN